MNSQEVVKPQEQLVREKNHGLPFSRRNLLKRVGAAAVGLAGMSLVGCGTESDSKNLNPQGVIPELAKDEGTKVPEVTVEDSTPTPTKTPEPTPTPEVKRDPNSLRELADKPGLTVGCVITQGWLKDSKWRGIMYEQFNVGKVARFNWNELEPQRGKFNFSLTDEMVDFAQKGDMKIFAQNLVQGATPGGGYIPKWLSDGGFSTQEIESMLRNYISHVMSRYRGKIDKWVVVNEAYPDKGRPNDFLFDTLGRDYVRIAFDEARKTDTQATLVYNDNSNHISNNPGNARIIAINKDIIAMLRKEGWVDDKFMLGVQGHLSGEETLSSRAITETLRSYGVDRIMITELDVDMSKVSGTPEQRGEIQAGRYSSFLQAAYDTGLCKDFAFEVIGDKFNAATKKNGPSASPTMYDDNLEPKPAYKAVQDFLIKVGTVGK